MNGIMANKLSPTFVRRARKPGRYGDGNGLLLMIRPSGVRSWIQRITIAGKRRDIGLGAYPAVGLAEARRRSAANVAVARAGGDPTRKDSPGPTKSLDELIKEAYRKKCLGKFPRIIEYPRQIVHLSTRRSARYRSKDEIKLDLIIAQNFRCGRDRNAGGCREKLPSDSRRIHLDHIMPVSKGGVDDISNFQVLYMECNSRKGGKFLDPIHDPRQLFIDLGDPK